jgi:hypothetical protein
LPQSRAALDANSRYSNAHLSTPAPVAILRRSGFELSEQKSDDATVVAGPAKVKLAGV